MSFERMVTSIDREITLLFEFVIDWDSKTYDEYFLLPKNDENILPIKT